MAPPKKSAPRARRPAALDAAELLRMAAQGEAPPLFLVTGHDYYSRDAILAELRRLLVAEGFEAFDAAAISGEEVAGEGFADQAEMLPMGGMAGGRRFLLVRRAEKIKERELPALSRYAASPAPTCCAVLVFTETKGPVLTALKKTAPVLDLPAPRDYQMARWLETQARRLRVPIEADAARAIAERAGEDHVEAMSELEKAALAGGGRKITRAMIEDLAGPGRDTNV